MMKPLLVWTYHRILPDGGSAAVAPAVFRRQVEYLRGKGYEFLDCAGLLDWLAGRLDRSRRYTMLTFDDGWADNWVWATPLLAELHVRAVLAVNTGLVDFSAGGFALRSAKRYAIVDSKTALAKAAFEGDRSSFLNLLELKRMAQSGVWDVQAHGASHLGCYTVLRHIRGFYPEHWHWTMERALGRQPFPGAPRAEFSSELAVPRTRLSGELAERLSAAADDVERRRLCAAFGDKAVERIESDDEFRSRVRQDLSGCRETLKEKIGVEPVAFFWPWGHWSGEGIRIAREIGYEVLFTMEKAAVAPSTPPTLIPRIAVPKSFERFVRQERVFASRLLGGLHTFWRRLTTG